MLYAVIGKKYVWFFDASNKEGSRQIANDILSIEDLPSGNIMSCFSPTRGYWKAVGKKIEEVRDLMDKIEKSEIIEIKRVKPVILDALYVTRPQKERWKK